jgi:hypothetical protein
MAQSKVTQSQSTFAKVCSVEINIRAAAPDIWNLLTDAKDFSRWNSTVAGIEGQVSEGGRLKLRVPGQSRTFTPTVSGFAPNERMTWSVGFAAMFQSVRTFQLKPRNDDSTDFVMEGPIFAQYVNCLKRAAERAP